MHRPVTAQERKDLAEEIAQAILRVIDKAGYRNGPSVSTAYSAANMVATRVDERKKAKVAS